VPKELYWICGKRAYRILPNDWFRSFFWAPSGLLSSCSSLRQGEKLGVSIYKERGNRKKRDALQIADWKDNEWLPEQIIQ
jgi:hypothetical protein